MRQNQFPDFDLASIVSWFGKFFELISLVLLVDIAKCIFVTHRSTYDIDSDIVPIKLVIVANALFTFFYIPENGSGKPLDRVIAFCMSTDTFTWIPQIVMMA